MSRIARGPLRAVLLDAAGTLMRPREPVGQAYARIARRYGVALPASRVGEAFRRVLRSAPPMLFPGEPCERLGELERAWWRERVRATFRAADGSARFSDFEACFQELFTYYSEPSSWKTLPGVRQALERLRGEGRRLAVASNFDRRLPRLLEGLGLAACFEDVMLPGELGCAKPDPDFFRAACRRLGVAPGATLHVGDDAEQDLAPARAAGLRCIDARSLATLAELPARIAALEEEACP